ncbi:hypothetical protein [Promicromonospora sp. NPDC050880]
MPTHEEAKDRVSVHEGRARSHSTGPVLVVDVGKGAADLSSAGSGNTA